MQILNCGEISLVYGADAEIKHYVANKIRFCTGFDNNATAIGFLKDGKIIGGVVYHNYDGINIHVSIACENKLWANRKRLHALFFYPFSTLQCERITVTIWRKNKVSRKIAEKLGFVLEGTIRNALPNRRDAMLYGLLKSECKWLNYGRQFS